MFARRKPRKSSTAVFSYPDGPLRRRPPEEIAYGTGKCALGRLLVAASDKGVVSIIVRDEAAGLLKELRSRFPKATLLGNEPRSRALVAKVAGHIAAPTRRFELPLDVRGTDFQKRVWSEVQKIPCGRTSTYAKIAEAIGAPKAVRAVGSSCTRCWLAFAVPCHRVLSTGGAGRDAQGSRRYRWVGYEAGLIAKRGRRPVNATSWDSSVRPPAKRRPRPADPGRS